MLHCQFCGRSFTNRAGFSRHLSSTERHHFVDDTDVEKHIIDMVYGIEIVNESIQQYVDQKVCVYDLRKQGIDIVKYLVLSGIKRSSKEERQTERYKKHYLTSIQQRFGSDITNVSQVPEIQRKKEQTYSDHYGSYDEYLSSQRLKMKQGFNDYLMDEARCEETLRKQRQTCHEKYGHENFGCGEKAKEKAHNTRMETILTWDEDERRRRTSWMREKLCSRGGFESKIEKMVQHALVDLNIEFVKHVHKWNFNYDLLLFDNILVEVQGDMWHARPDKYIETDLIIGKILVSDIWKKDKKKKEVAELNGYTLVYFWEHEIRARSHQQLCDLIIQRLSECSL